MSAEAWLSRRWREFVKSLPTDPVEREALVPPTCPSSPDYVGNSKGEAQCSIE